MSYRFNPFSGSFDYYESGSSGGSAWGSITGTLSAQTDLQSALDAKMPLAGGVFAINAPVAYQLNASPFYFLTKTEVGSNVLTIGGSGDAASLSSRHMSFNANGNLSLGNIFAAQITLSPGTGRFHSHFYDITATTGTANLGASNAYWIGCYRERDYIKSQSNGAVGQATLVGGTVTVSNTSVTVNSRIFLSVSTVGGTQGFLSYTKSAGASFTINSTSATETSVVDWRIVESF